MFRLPFAIGLLIIPFATLISTAAPPSIEEVKVGIEKNYASYNDVEFIYDVQSKNGDGQYVKTQNTYRLHIPKEGHPWQYFAERKTPITETPSSINRFAVFNGTETWIFSKGLHERSWNRCAIVSGYQWDGFTEDCYSQLLVKSVVGLPFTTLTPKAYDKFWEQKKDAQHFASKRQLDGHDVFVFTSNYGRGREYELHVLGPPHYMIVRVKATETASKKVVDLIDVKKIGQEQGITFPQKGHILRTIAHASHINDQFKGTDYSFEVVKVNRLADVKPDTWFPEIPPGTTIANHITNENSKLPHDK